MDNGTGTSKGLIRLIPFRVGNEFTPNTDPHRYMRIHVGCLRHESRKFQKVMDPIWMMLD